MDILQQALEVAKETPHQRNERRGISADDWPCRFMTTPELLDKVEAEYEGKREISHRLALLRQILETTPEDILGRSVWDWV